MGLYHYFIPATTDYPVPTFAVGDRVRLKAEHLGPGVDPARWTGTVAIVPDSTQPIVSLGNHRLGDEVSVDLDDGGRGVAETSHWEAVK